MMWFLQTVAQNLASLVPTHKNQEVVKNLDISRSLSSGRGVLQRRNLAGIGHELHALKARSGPLPGKSTSKPKMQCHLAAMSDSVSDAGRGR